MLCFTTAPAIPVTCRVNHGAADQRSAGRHQHGIHEGGQRPPWVLVCWQGCSTGAGACSPSAGGGLPPACQMPPRAAPHATRRAGWRARRRVAPLCLLTCGTWLVHTSWQLKTRRPAGATLWPTATPHPRHTSPLGCRWGPARVPELFGHSMLAQTSQAFGG